MERTSEKSKPPRVNSTAKETNTYILKNIYFQIINVTVYYEATETIKKDRFVLT